MFYVESIHKMQLSQADYIHYGASSPLIVYIKDCVLRQLFDLFQRK